MITSKKEYDEIINSFKQFMKWYQDEFLIKFKKGLDDLNESMNDFIRHYYKDIMFEINHRTVKSSEKRSKEIVSGIKKLEKHNYPSILNKIIKNCNELENTYTFWYNKFMEFRQKVKQEFGEFPSPLKLEMQRFYNETFQLRYGDKILQGLFIEYLHETPLKNEFDTKPIGKLILAKEYLMQKERGISNKDLKMLKKYSVEEDWTPDIVLRNKYGTFKPKIHFHVYIHHMYKVEFIEEVFTDKLIEDIKKTYFRDIHLGESEALEKRAKFEALVKFFKEDVNGFTLLLLNFLKLILKLAYLKSSTKLIRSNYIDVNCCIRDLTSYGAACQPGTGESLAALVESINGLLINFSLFCVEFAEKNHFFEEKKAYQVGKGFSNVPNIKNWDYDRNKPQLSLNIKEFKTTLEAYYNSVNNQFPKVIYYNLISRLHMWIHELTHHFDEINNPNSNYEVNLVYKLNPTPRINALVQFLCDLRSDSITQWRDAQIVSGKKHIHYIYNGIIFDSPRFVNSFSSAMIKIRELSLNKNYVLPDTLGRVFGNEFYAIGYFYLILSGIKKSIEKEISYSIYSSRGMRIEKHLQKENKRIFKLFGRYLNLSEINESALDEAIRRTPEFKFKEWYQNYRKEQKNYINDIDYYLPKYKEEMVMLIDEPVFQKVKKENPELANVLTKLNYVSYHYFQKIGLIYWELQRLNESSKEYKKLFKKYEKIKKFILEKQYIFNFITGRIKTRHKTYQAGGEILQNKLFDKNETKKLIDKGIMKSIEINYKNRHLIGKLLPKKAIYFSIFNQRVVEEVFDEVHNMATSLEFFRFMKEMDHYFKIPKQLQLFQSEKELMEIFEKVGEMDLLSVKQKGFELTEEEIKKFFSNLKN